MKPLSMRDPHARPTVLITGASGNLGRSVAKALMGRYRIVGLDREAREAAPGGGDYPVLAVDLSAEDSVALALQAVRGA